MIISALAYKGGVGKTTIAVNLAAALNAALVDTDEQRSAVDWGAVETYPWTIKNASAWIKQVQALGSLVVVDSPPNLSHVVQTIIDVSDLLLIPCTASGADIRSTGKLLQEIPEDKTAWIVPSKIDVRTSPGKELPEVLKAFGLHVTPPIRQRTAHVLAFSAGQWIGEFSPNSEAHTEFMELVKEVKQWLKKQTLQRT
jgi:chromosome partitioning protein